MGLEILLDLLRFDESNTLCSEGCKIRIEKDKTGKYIIFYFQHDNFAVSLDDLHRVIAALGNYG